MNDLYVKITGKNASSDTGGIQYAMYAALAIICFISALLGSIRTSCFSYTRHPRYYRSYHIKYQYPKMREGIGACN